MKSKALFIKHNSQGFKNVGDAKKTKGGKGVEKELKTIIQNGLREGSVKEIYGILITKLISKNDSLIPSRNEKRMRKIKWRHSWSNLSCLRGLGPEERCFAWKLSQDMLEVGARIHRKGAVKECKKVMGNGTECGEIETLRHKILSCPSVEDCSGKVIRILKTSLLDKDVNDEQIMCLSFKHRHKGRLQISLWFLIKCLHAIFNRDFKNYREIFRLIIDEIEWNLKMKIVVGSTSEMVRLKSVLENNC